MKYFSLYEILLSIPASLIFGVCIAFFYALLTELLKSGALFLEIKKYIIAKERKTPYKFGAECKKVTVVGRTRFVLSEIFNCLFIVLCSLLFSVFIYVISDGIPRLYICVLVLSSFALCFSFFKKAFSAFSFYFVGCFIRIIFFVTYLILYFPLKTRNHFGFFSRKKAKNTVN